MTTSLSSPWTQPERSNAVGAWMSRVLNQGWVWARTGALGVTVPFLTAAAEDEVDR
jgi:hypothetical protein